MPKIKCTAQNEQLFVSDEIHIIFQKAVKKGKNNPARSKSAMKRSNIAKIAKKRKNNPARNKFAMERSNIARYPTKAAPTSKKNFGRDHNGSVATLRKYEISK